MAFTRYLASILENGKQMAWWEKTSPTEFRKGMLGITVDLVIFAKIKTSQILPDLQYIHCKYKEDCPNNKESKVIKNGGRHQESSKR